MRAHPNSTHSIHPAGLRPLFFTELWERFSYYGMRGLLILYMTAPVNAGGLAFDTARAGAIYGLYSGSVYLACLPGGWLADRFLGAQRATLIGGIVILCGHLCLAIPMFNAFYLGLGLVIIGTGFLKPNVSMMVGQLYHVDDPRRDSGFSIYYMGINLGAFLAPLACGWLALSPPFRALLTQNGIDPMMAWHYGFGAAAFGMALGLASFLRGTPHFNPVSARPANSPSAADHRRLRLGLIGVVTGCIALGGLILRGVLTIGDLSNLFGIGLLLATVIFFAWIFLDRSWTNEERRRLQQILTLFLAAVVFWSLFEQGGSTLNLFAERNTQRYVEWLGYEFPATWFQSLNPLMIIALTPVFAWSWIALGSRNPSSTVKFTAGLAWVSAGFAVLILAATYAEAGIQVSPWWLVATYGLHTLGELCLSPVGLSAMSRLAPARIAGLTMGVWFLATSVGNYLGGRAASAYDAFTLPQLFTAVTLFGLAATVLLACVAKFLNSSGR
ncbi:MAG: MFS transporter [Gammaproteobacteria bacterium]|nr:MFS transporter [Gammaproteobacteria bacterium]